MPVTGRVFLAGTGGGGGAVSSVFTRTGAVVANTGDYTAAQVTNAADKSSGSQQAFTGEVKAPDFSTAGLTGSTAAARFVGGTASGSPGSGTFAVGDFVIDQTGVLWICTVAGSPGTWVNPSANAGVTSFKTRTGAVVPANADYLAVASGGLTGATAATRFVGGTASGSPGSGTFAVGDFVIDQTGVLWICTGAGTPGTWVQLVKSITAGTGISVNQATGAVTVTNTGVTSAVAGQAIGLSGATGAVTIGVNGVESTNVVATSGSAQTLAAVATDIANDITLSANCTVTMPTAVRGAFCYAIMRQAAAGGPFTVAFTGVKWPGGTAPTMSSGANNVDRYDFVSDGTNWYGVITGQNFH